MKRMLAAGLWILCLLPAAYAQTEPSQALFQEANTCYRTGDYAKAASLYEQLAQKTPSSAPVFYNLGNAYVRLGNLSLAVLNYEKALRLDPRHADIRHNLNYTRGLLEYRLEDTRNWYLRGADALLRYFTDREIFVTVMLVALFFLLGGILYFLLGRGVFWNPWQKFVAIVLALAVVVAVAKHAQNNMLADAIVLKKECEVRYGPSQHDQVAFRMGEGLKVFVVDRREDWSRILLTNGESGWVPAADIAEVKV